LDHEHICQPVFKPPNSENLGSLKLFQINSLHKIIFLFGGEPLLDQVVPNLLVTMQPVLLVMMFVIKQTKREARFNFSFALQQM
jgi:hypothetical protein